MDISIEVMEKTLSTCYYGKNMKPSPGKSPEPFLHYLPYSKEDEKLGMVCTTAGSVEVGPCSAYPPFKNQHPAIFRSVVEGRALPEFHIIYITKGEGTYETEGRIYQVKPGSAIMLFPMMKHRYQPLFETGWHEFWVGFKGAYFDRLLEENILPRNRVFYEPGLHEQLISAFGGILEEVKAQKPLYQFRACSLIVSLLAEILARERRKEQPAPYQQIVEEAKSLMEIGISGGLNMTHISEQLGTSTSRLNEIFKTYTGMTPYQYFIHIKIRKAQELLEQKDLSIKEVAYRMGFEDQYHFSRLFKKKTGTSPLGWKKALGF